MSSYEVKYPPAINICEWNHENGDDAAEKQVDGRAIRRLFNRHMEAFRYLDKSWIRQTRSHCTTVSPTWSRPLPGSEPYAEPRIQATQPKRRYSIFASTANSTIGQNSPMHTRFARDDLPMDRCCDHLVEAPEVCHACRVSEVTARNVIHPQVLRRSCRRWGFLSP